MGRVLALACVLSGVSCTWLSGDPSEPPPRQGCAALADVDLSAIGGEGTAVSEAVVGTSRGYEACEVRGTLAPSIGFQVLLPTEGYTGRFLQTGCGGFCGRLNIRAPASDGCVVLEGGGFALATTDLGHDSPTDARFGAEPQKKIDFAHRAVHLTALTAKALIRSFYGKDPEHSYFAGCSEGGREALMEAQRYPEDFDGIIAGAPLMNFVTQSSFFHAWQAKSNQGERYLPLLRWNDSLVVAKAAIDACDELDGLKDGIIGDPLACRVDPTTLQCKRDGQDNCLAPEQIEAVTNLYRGPRDVHSGMPLSAGPPLPGSEPSWEGVFLPIGPSNRLSSERIAGNALNFLLFEKNPEQFSKADMAYDAAMFEQLTALHGLYDTTDPDLRPFLARGGQVDPMAWLGGSPGSAPGHHRVLPRRRGLAGRRQHEAGGSTVSATGDVPLLSGAWPAPVRLAHPSARLGGGRQSAWCRGHVAGWGRRSARSTAGSAGDRGASALTAGVSLSAGCPVQG